MEKLIKIDSEQTPIEMVNKVNGIVDKVNVVIDTIADVEDSLKEL